MRGSAAFRVSVAPGGGLAPSWVRDPLSRNAGASPSLDLRFADSKSLVDSSTGANLVTFTRASSGTYVGSDRLIKTATTNEARFDHNPTTGESLGLLVEEQRTNSLTGSQDFSNTYWNNSNSTRTNNSSTAPDNTTTACLVAGLGTTYGGLVRRYTTFAASTTYTFSCFAKAGTINTIGLRLTASCVNGDNYCYYNLATGVATAITPSAGTVVAVSMTAFPNGWYRCILTYTTSASQGGSDFIDIALTTNTGNHNYTGTGNALIWGAMLESGASFPTSYIPTTTATVTRSADVASITGGNFSSWYNQTEGTVFADYQQYATGGNAVNISDNTGSNFINIFTSAAANTRGSANVFTSGTNNGRIDSGGAFVANSNTKASYGLSAGSRSFSAQGNTVTTSATPTALPTVNRMNIGVNQDATSGWNNGTIRRLTYWPRRLPNATLQQITR